MKLKTVYICGNCQHESPKWIGRCSSCDAWNSFVEDVVESKPSGLSSTPRVLGGGKIENLSSYKNFSKKTLSGIKEFDRVIGDGITDGSVTLLSGEPGIGKSTLTLQLANMMSKQKKTLIVSGEESVEQIASRAKRLGVTEKNLEVVTEFNLEAILDSILKNAAKFVIIDSIQVISSMDLPGTAGSISQVRYCAEKIIELAKKNSIPIMIIGHVTKDGNLAGPKVLEHMVDTVIQLEGDRFQQFRILRASKNRFGSCSEVGIFEMNENGMQEVKNPSEQFLEGRKDNTIGSIITVAIEGTRPFLIEVQALVSKSPFGYPKRAANGFSLNRLQILVAVLEKYARMNLQDQDVYVNVVGGIKLNEPACDLAIITAISSSFLKKTLPSDSVIFGEVGLTGELRKVSHHEKREKEASKLGFKNIISSNDHKEISEVLRQLV
jgi:DNA repair protein RadA/Sms